MAASGVVAVEGKKMADKVIPTMVTSEVEWAREGTHYSTRSCADKTARLPGGIYHFVQTMFGWYLERDADNFEFPFKIYNAGDHIIKRVFTYWKTNSGNLGVLMNGLRGAGKSLTAQLLANRLIQEQNLPVLVVRDPVPLDTILNAVQQDMLVIFDEFEKSHDKDAQQSLLTTVDGMSRSSFKRLFIFTTNTTSINENFLDRPSRIHYQFEFARVADEIIEGLIEDSLPADLMHFKSDIISFLATRQICTIDIVKAVIAEVRTFREAPLMFADLLNISKGEPPAYTISILNPETNNIEKVFKDYFKLNSNSEHQVALLGESRRAVEEFIEKKSEVDIYSDNWAGMYVVRLLEKCSEEGCWLAQLAIPHDRTIYKPFNFLYGSGNHYFLDKRPANWSFPYTPESVKGDDDAREKISDLFNLAENHESVYGTEDKLTFKIRIAANRTSRFSPGTFTPTKDFNF